MWINPLSTMTLTIIIPSLNPDEKLLQVVTSLHNNGYEDIILVNDGSDADHLQPFKDAQKIYNCTVLTHNVNKGKGRALKTAFDYYINSNRQNAGVITVDGDNQHNVKDIIACENAMIAKSDNIILGCRNFNQPDVPPKSRFGNKTTSFIFKTICGLNISDTQTGLRAIPKKYLNDFINISGERFEYETNMLLEMKQKDIPFSEVSIKTVYINDNATTHFNPIVDSIKIYAIILKFFLSSIISSLVDLGSFTLVEVIAHHYFSTRITIFLATVVSRLLSSIFNYSLNRNAVFKHNGSVKATMVKYYILCIIQFFLSFSLVYGLSMLLKIDSSIGKTVIKAIVDTSLFFGSFKVQQNWVFKDKKKRLS